MGLTERLNTYQKKQAEDIETEAAGRARRKELRDQASQVDAQQKAQLADTRQVILCSRYQPLMDMLQVREILEELREGWGAGSISEPSLVLSKVVKTMRKANHASYPGAHSAVTGQETVLSYATNIPEPYTYQKPGGRLIYSDYEGGYRETASGVFYKDAELAVSVIVGEVNYDSLNAHGGERKFRNVEVNYDSELLDARKNVATRPVFIATYSFKAKDSDSFELFGEFGYSSGHQQINTPQSKELPDRLEDVLFNLLTQPEITPPWKVIHEYPPRKPPLPIKPWYQRILG